MDDCPASRAGGREPSRFRRLWKSIFASISYNVSLSFVLRKHLAKWDKITQYSLANTVYHRAVLVSVRMLWNLALKITQLHIGREECGLRPKEIGGRQWWGWRRCQRSGERLE